MRKLLPILTLTFTPFAFADEPQIIPAPVVEMFAPQVSEQKIEGGYAIVVSQKTLADKDWAQVVATLQKKYGTQAEVMTWENKVEEAQPALAKKLPRYTCFVATPKEASRVFVGEVHRLTRNLNSDPYPDTIWGILTGATPQDANRIASTCAPLKIHSALGTTGVNLALFDNALVLSDGKEGEVITKGAVAEKINYNKEPTGDRVQPFVDALHEMKPEVLFTSGHACENILEMPYGFGAVFGKHGTVLGMKIKGKHGNLKLDKTGFEINSPNPKVWLASGNCLTGSIRDDNSIALGMMHNGGVTQMVGYTVETWYGAGGWGMADWFFNQPYTLAESFFINDVAITRRLVKEFPGKEKFELTEAYIHDMNLLAKDLGIDEKMPPEKAKDLMGLVWDHDSVAFYGDPAWDVRMSKVVGAQKFEGFPWFKETPKDIVSEFVLPSTLLDETPDCSRAVLFLHFAPLIKDCKTSAEALAIIQKNILEETGVAYSTKREKPNQSPLESMRSHIASCTGLSLLFAQSCRAVGIPARVAGVENWTDGSGNHTWVEVWVNGAWHFTDYYPDPQGLDHGWVLERLLDVNGSNPTTAVWASCFNKTDKTDLFPLVWRDKKEWLIPAENVSLRYQQLAQGQAKEKARTREIKTFTPNLPSVSH